MSDRLSPEDLRSILAKTNKQHPAQADLEALRQALQTQPHLWRVAGDLALHAQRQTVENLAATPVTQESLAHGLQVLRNDLGYASAPLLERLVIEQVGLCWLRLNLAEYQYTAVDKAGGTFAKRRYWEQRLSAVQVRYLRAIEALARIRKLARTTPLQVNIGGQQVIAAGDVHGGR